MTRARRTVGRIAFVGAGPGDPGLLTMRAAEALASASVVVTDPDVPDDVTAMAAGADIRPAVGEPADLARGIAWVLEAGKRGGDLSGAARGKVERDFSIESVAARYLELYRSVSHRPPAGTSPL